MKQLVQSRHGIFDPHFVMEYNWYCDEYSIDTISTGVTIGFFMECSSGLFDC